MHLALPHVHTFVSLRLRLFVYTKKSPVSNLKRILDTEAEKAANINVLEFLTYGAFGRVYLGGYEADIEEAAKAALGVLSTIDGRENPGR